MSDQFTRQKIMREIERIKTHAEQAQKEVAEMRRIFNEAHARLVQERDAAIERAEKAEREVERLGKIVTECDGIECVKHDGLVRIAVKERKEAEERASKLLTAIMDCIDHTNNRQSEWGERAEKAFQYLEDALATDSATKGVPPAKTRPH